MADQPAWWEEVLTLSHSAYLHISRDQRIIDAVGDTWTLLGREPAALIGMALGELKDIRAQLGAAVAESLARREIRPGETWGFEDGAGCYYGLADGSFVIKLTAALKVDQGIVGRLADQLPILVAYVDTELCFRLNNQAYVDFIGIDREALYGQPVASVMEPASFAKVQPRLRRALAGEEVTYEDRLTLADGRTFYFKVHYIPDFLDGDVVGVYAIIQDISEYRAMIQLLRDVHSGVNGQPTRSSTSCCTTPWPISRWTSAWSAASSATSTSSSGPPPRSPSSRRTTPSPWAIPAAA